MKKSFLILLSVLSLGSAVCFAQKSTFKQISDDGIANVIFANESISKGEEANSELKNKFWSR